MQAKPSFFDKQEPNINDFLQMSDVASQLRQIEENVVQQLDNDKTKEKLRSKLLDLAKIKGENITPEQIDKAIDDYYSRQYSFKAPEKRISTGLANLYINRTQIARKVGIPAITGLALTGAVWLTAVGANTVYKGSLERRAEESIERVYHDKQDLQRNIEEIFSSPIKEQLPRDEKNLVNSILSSAKSRLAETNPILEVYCPEGSAKTAITKQNMDEAQKQIQILENIINPAKSELEESSKIIKNQQQYISTEQSLESLINEIRGTDPLPVFLKRAEIAYSSGVNCIDKRQLPQAKEYRSNLVAIKSDIGNFSILTDKTEKIYNSVVTTAREDPAKKIGMDLYKEAKQFINLADVPRLNHTVSALESLNSVLEQEYTLRIINRSGIKSGIDRYFTDKHGKRSSGFYIIVEAIDRNGNEVPVKIRSEENGSIETVNMWGERVPEYVYEKVKADKLDNGIINNDLVGKKERGYLTEVIEMDGVNREGQITRW